MASRRNSAGASKGLETKGLEQYSRVCLEAAQREDKQSKNFRWPPSRLQAMESSIGKGLRNLLASNEEMGERRRIIDMLDDFVQKEITGSYVAPFGAYELNLNMPGTGLDLSVQVPSSYFRPDGIIKVDRVHVLDKLLRNVNLLRYDGEKMAKDMHPSLRSAVPTLRFHDRTTDLEVHLSVCNSDGIFRSTFIRYVMDIDPRFRQLCYLVKAWAKAKNINDPRMGTFNSITLYLLVAFHLQTISPPILPPFSAILGEDGPPGTEPDLRRLEGCRHRAKHFADVQFGQRNKDSVPKLLASFFGKMACMEDLWVQGLCASTLQGQWILKQEDRNIMKVEDFANPSLNTARAVHQRETELVYSCIRQAVDVMDKENPAKVPHFLFGPVVKGRDGRDTSGMSAATDVASGAIKRSTVLTSEKSSHRTSARISVRTRERNTDRTSAMISGRVTSAATPSPPSLLPGSHGIAKMAAARGSEALRRSLGSGSKMASVEGHGRKGTARARGRRRDTESGFLAVALHTRRETCNIPVSVRTEEASRRGERFGRLVLALLTVLCGVRCERVGREASASLPWNGRDISLSMSLGGKEVSRREERSGLLLLALLMMLCHVRWERVERGARNSVPWNASRNSSFFLQVHLGVKLSYVYPCFFTWNWSRSCECFVYLFCQTLQYWVVCFRGLSFYGWDDAFLRENGQRGRESGQHGEAQVGDEETCISC